MIIKDGTANAPYAKVNEDGLLMVALDGFTLDDLVRLYPGIGALHVKDGDKWVPVQLDDLKKQTL